MNEWILSVAGSVVAAIIFEVLRPIIPVLYGRLRRTGAAGELRGEAAASARVPSEAWPATGRSRASVGRPEVSQEGVFEERRRRFGDFVLGVAFYFLHIVCVYLAICLPVQFLVSPERHYLLLSEARLIGSHLPDWRLDTSLMSLDYLKVTLCATVLLFVVARVVSWPVWSIGAYFGREDLVFRRTAQLFVFFLLCFVLSAHIIYLYSSVSYGAAWGIVVAVFVGLVIVSRLRNKKKAG